MLSFDDFTSKTDALLLNNIGASNVFDFLLKPNSINLLIVFSDLNMPVLTGIAKQLEDKYAKDANFPLNHYRNRQYVGKMIKYIMDFYGYSPTNTNLKDNRLRNFANADHFKTSAIYSLTHTPQKKLIIQST